LRPLIGLLITRIRGESTEPSSRRQSISSKGDNVQPLQQLSSHTTETGNDIPSLPSTEKLLIDLEGIRTDDGYGYTVTIEGPTRRRRPIFGRAFWQSANSKHGSLEKDGTDEGLASAATHDSKGPEFMINTTSSYAVKEEYRDPNTIPVREQRRSSLSSEEMEQRIEEASQGLFDLSLLASSDASPHK
jgi:hypothetical protein